MRPASPAVEETQPSIRAPTAIHLARSPWSITVGRREALRKVVALRRDSAARAKAAFVLRHRSLSTTSPPGRRPFADAPAAAAAHASALTSSVSAIAASSACASVISGISGVGASLRARARERRALGGSAGRLVELGERKRRYQIRTRAPCSFAIAIAVRNSSSAGAGFGSRLRRISPRRRCRKGSEQ